MEVKIFKETRGRFLAWNQIKPIPWMVIQDAKS